MLRIDTVLDARDEPQYRITGEMGTFIVYRSPAFGPWCVGDSQEPIAEGLKLLPAISLALEFATHPVAGGQQISRMVRLAKRASA